MGATIEAWWPERKGAQSSGVCRTRSAITARLSSMANITVRSNPWGPFMRTRNPPLNGVGHDPCFVRRAHVLAARAHGRLDALTAIAGDAFDVEHGDRHER